MDPVPPKKPSTIIKGIGSSNAADISNKSVQEVGESTRLRDEARATTDHHGGQAVNLYGEIARRRADRFLCDDIGTNDRRLLPDVCQVLSPRAPSVLSQSVVYKQVCLD